MMDIFPNTIPPEEWRDIDQYLYNGICPGYWISTYGRLYYEQTTEMFPNEDNNKNLENKYLTVYLHMMDKSVHQWYIHRLMMYMFKFRSDWEELEVNHKDGIKYHNWLWNLEWATSSQNKIHAFKNNLMHSGEDVSYSTINNKQADIIANLLSQGFLPSQIQKQLEGVFPPGVHIK